MALPLHVATVSQFNPRTISGLTAWWDFSDTSTWYTDGNGKIVQIADKSGNSRTALQTTASNRPGVSTINGLSCGDWGTTAASTQGFTATAFNALEIAAVAVVDGYTSFPDFLTIVSSGSGGVSGFPSSGNLNWLTNTQGSALGQANVMNGVETFVAFPAAASPFLLQTYKTTGSFSLSQVGYDRSLASRSWRGRIGEILCFSRPLSNPERIAVRRGLALKWNIPVIV